MDDEDRADVARQGVALVERVEKLGPDAIRSTVKEAAAEAAGDAVLAVARAAGVAPRQRTGPTNEQVERTLAALEARNTAEFDERLVDAVRRARDVPAPVPPTRDAPEEPWLDRAELRELARLRRSFPPEARELATLVFACSDLLEDLAERDQPPSPDELAKKEVLVARIADLLAPRAADSLRAFVAHVVALSRDHRGAR